MFVIGVHGAVITFVRMCVCVCLRFHEGWLGGRTVHPLTRLPVATPPEAPLHCKHLPPRTAAGQGASDPN